MHKTISVQARVKITSFAELARALEREGAGIRSKSDILWRAVEQLAFMYNRKHEVEPFASVHDAVAYMDSIGIPLQTNSRATKSLLQAAADEAYFIENGTPPPDVVMKRDLLRDEREGVGNMSAPRKSFLDMTKEERIQAAMKVAANLRETGVISGKVVSGEPKDQTSIDKQQAEDVRAALQTKVTQRDADFQAQQKAAILMMKGGTEDGDSY